jgi:hypothetical protein
MYRINNHGWWAACQEARIVRPVPMLVVVHHKVRTIV